MATTIAVLFFAVALAAAATAGDAAFVQHTFVVSQVTMRHLCNDTVITVVNGELPGPTIEVREGDSVAVHVVNKSPYGLTIHWHGVKQQLNCWADGAGMITQCPIQPGNNFTYRFDVVGQEGTLWWHAHVAGLRATVHGAIFIRPRSSYYPFPKPDREIPIVIGEWWEKDLVELDKSLMSGFFFDMPRGATINGKLGDLYNCSGVTEDNYVLNVKHGETYLLRIVNAALFSEYYLKIAGHRFTVVASDANYVKPYTTDMIAIAPGETMDVLLVADVPPPADHGRRSSYYMVILANQPPAPAIQIPKFISRALVCYDDTLGSCDVSSSDGSNPAVMPGEMPEQHDALPSFYFRGNLTSLVHPQLPPVPINVDQQILIALDSGSIVDNHVLPSSSSTSSPDNNKKKKNKAAAAGRMVAMMNNVSFELPSVTPLLETFYYNNTGSSSTDNIKEFPDRPPKMFTFSDVIQPTSKATLVRRLEYNTTVEVVFQSPVLADSYSNPMHLHGHDFFVLAQGIGRYDAQRHVKTYNLVDPPAKNTVHVPIFGWAAIRFVTTNPGVWYMHCHYEHHSSTGMAVALVVRNGPTMDTSLPPPPADYPICHKHGNGVAYV